MNVVNFFKVLGANIRLSETFPPFALSNDIWYEIEIVAKGNHLEAYIDGEPVVKVEDDTISSGKVDFVVGITHAHFDDLIISGDDVEDGGSWGPAKHPEEKAVEPKGKLAATWGEIKRSR